LVGISLSQVTAITDEDGPSGRRSPLQACAMLIYQSASADSPSATVFRRWNGMIEMAASRSVGRGFVSRLQPTHRQPPSL